MARLFATTSPTAMQLGRGAFLRAHDDRRGIANAGENFCNVAATADAQQMGRWKRLTGVAPRAIWATLWIQSSWGGKPHRCQRSQSPQVKPDLRAHELRAILLGNSRRIMWSVRITVLHAHKLDSHAEYSTAIISGIDQDQIKRRSAK
jgi:hypothetical protein